MRPRQRKVHQWAHKLRRARKKLPESVRIKSRDHCSEAPPSEVSVEVEASFFMDPLSTSKENVQDTEVQEFKVNEEAEMPLPQVEDCWTSGSRYQASEGDECYNEEDDTQPSLVIENFNLPDSGKAKSSRSKRRLLLDSSGTSDRSKRGHPQGSLGPTFYHQQISSELATLRQEVRKLHTRLDAMTNVMNALYRHTQNIQQILEAQVGIDWGQSEREISTQKAAVQDQPVIPPPDHSYSQPPAPPVRVLHSLLPQPDPVEHLHSPPRLYPAEWLEQLGSYQQSTPVPSVVLCYRSPATPNTHPHL